MELMEARLATQFTGSMSRWFGVGNANGDLSALGVFSSANAAAKLGIANGIDLSTNLGMAGLGSISMGRVVGSANPMFGSGFGRLADMKTGSAIGPVSAAFNGSISGLSSMGMSGFADTNAWAGSFNGNSLQNTSGFSGIGLDGLTHNLDLLASTGAAAAGSVSGSGFDMSGVGMASINGVSGTTFAAGGFGGMGMAGIGAMGGFTLQNGAVAGRVAASLNGNIRVGYIATNAGLKQHAQSRQSGSGTYMAYLSALQADIASANTGAHVGAVVGVGFEYFQLSESDAMFLTHGMLHGIDYETRWHILKHLHANDGRITFDDLVRLGVYEEGDL